MSHPPLSRRERIHAETVREIRGIALRQVDEGGLATLSLNAIAKELGMSGPALYRYFASRDELLGALHTDIYAQLVTAVREAAEASTGRAPSAHLAAYASAYRGWALKHPRRYALLFGGRAEEFKDPAEAIAEIHEGMLLLLRLLADIAGDRPVTRPPDALDRQLTAWSRRRAGNVSFPPHILRLGVLFWTRLHGIVSLELSSVFKDMGLDGGALLDDEVKRIIDAAGGGH
ncbi:TetR/AcrR family transcriptional regulator [Archangium violaceum]|uniref:TetR/AcrR family transcriptional regulator n=1 Tax=Archangium violaceum TaxID=83451 RepID=UPI0019517B79|nr:TetR/AcrR family transcriptional regulator [Archangium violaceum]QRN99642.1 TetR/AcrR family transcriptional regulator [Archangium violaceum]